MGGNDRPHRGPKRKAATELPASDSDKSLYEPESGASEDEATHSEDEGPSRRPAAKGRPAQEKEATAPATTGTQGGG